MELSIVVPVYNEAKTVQKILKKVADVPLGKWQKEIIIVNDGSKDATVTEVNKILPYLKKRAKNVEFIIRPQNRGKGAAVKDGLKKITGDAVITQDADLEYDPFEWPKLLEKYENSKATIIFGSRLIDFFRPGYFLIALGVKISTNLINLLYGCKISDIYTCYKLTRVKDLKTIEYYSDGFEIDIEIVCKLLKKGFKVSEVPISYHPRSVEEGKKMTVKHGLVGLWTIIKNSCLFCYGQK